MLTGTRSMITSASDAVSSLTTDLKAFVRNSSSPLIGSCASTLGVGVGASGVVSGAGPADALLEARSSPKPGSNGAAAEASMLFAGTSPKLGGKPDSLTSPEVHASACAACVCKMGLLSGDAEAGVAPDMPLLEGELSPACAAACAAACASINSFNTSCAAFARKSFEARSRVRPAWSFQAAHRWPRAASGKASSSSSTAASSARKASAASRLTSKKACSLLFALRLAASFASRSSLVMDRNFARTASAFSISSRSTSVR
mmetsp:Transcript_30249/g.87183  ORF Transcript_30249/g.87183 Transcript_30249/m.87183 type:complete len:260 (+) Transcript_30249:340-1119(+)